MEPERPHGAKEPADLVLTLRPGAVLAAQLAVTALLALASLAGQISKHLLGHPYVYGLVRLFDLDSEANVPTAYSSASLLACALVLVALGRAERDRGLRLLGAAFLALSVDELVSFHETVGSEVVARLLGGRPQGLFHFAWVIPGLAVVAALAVASLPLLRRMPRGVRSRVVLAGALYVGGALGVELAGGHWASHHGKEGLAYGLITTTEEVLELLGVALFMNALLRHACTLSGRSAVELRVGLR